ncbi:MAG: hypothetical protein MHM6MM_006964 [Cercozoa sp. M6MM]
MGSDASAGKVRGVTVVPPEVEEVASAAGRATVCHRVSGWRVMGSDASAGRIERQECWSRASASIKESGSLVTTKNVSAPEAAGRYVNS